MKGKIIGVTLGALTIFGVENVVAQPKNVFSVSTRVLGIVSGSGTTDFNINSGYNFEYDRYLTDLMSLTIQGNIMLRSSSRRLQGFGNQTQTQTETIIMLGTSLRFWPSKKFSGFYAGPGFRFYLQNTNQPQAFGQNRNTSTTRFGIFGDLGYRFMIGGGAVAFGGNLGFSFGNNQTFVDIAGVASFGFAF